MSTKKVLKSLLEGNSLSSILDTLSELSLEKADELCDLQLNRNAKDWSRNSLLLKSVANKIED
jgi:hypothetical protein